MVIAGVLIDEKDEDKLREIKVKDSKMLTPKKREELAIEIRKIAKAIKVIRISPQEIDSRNAVGTNLNTLEAMKCAEIIEELSPNQVYIDSPTSPNAQTFGHHISKHFKNSVASELICAHKADVKFPCVSAASIIAKTERDKDIELIKKEIGFEFGSGYSADDVTKKFLDENHDKVKNHIRKSWATSKNLKAKKEQRSLFDF